MPEYKNLTEPQKKLYSNLKAAMENKGGIAGPLKDAKDDLLQVLTTAGITKEYPDGEKCTLTLLGFALSFIDQDENVKAILDAIKDEEEVLKEVLTTANIIVNLPDGTKRTLTPLGFAISMDFVDHKNRTRTKVILDAIKDKEEVLKEVFTTANITMDSPDGIRRTLTPLDFAMYIDCIDHKNSTRTKVILDAIKDKTKNSKVLRAIDQVERIIAFDKAKNFGLIFGFIAALAVGGGCFAAGVQLPILTIIGIVVAAALVVGIVAGSITYSVLKPSDKLNEPGLETANQPVSERTC